MSNNNIKIRMVKPKDREDVLTFIFEHFYEDEPLGSTEPKLLPGESDRNDILECLKEDTSIMAVRETDDGEELIGVNIAVPLGPSSIEKHFEDAEREGDTKYGQILKLLGVAGRNADVFKRYNVDKIFYSSMTCVKASARGKNLGTRLKIELMALGKSLGYKLLTADCTSFYSAAICERLGMERVGFIAYKDYVDENNKPIFNPPAPHVGLNSFAIRL